MLIEKAGAFSIVLECVDPQTAKKITNKFVEVIAVIRIYLDDVCLTLSMTVQGASSR